MPARAALLACLLTIVLSLSVSNVSFAEDLPAIPPIRRLLPPPGIEVPAEVRQELEAKLNELAPRIKKLTDKQHRPDIEVFAKAVDFALRFDEFYDKKDFDKARWALQQAEERLSLAEKNEFPWTKQTGLVVRGYYSSIDGSVQPYGLVIPDKHDFDKPCPLYVFLHGRGDKETDLHFMFGRARSKGEIVPDNAIVVHPFGRQCIGFKSAGEIDVLEAVDHVRTQYETTHQTALVGFSMGGAGAWHLGAHYPYMWDAVSPGAGFVDVARYQKLKPASYPPIYEQRLWGVYDVPAYTRNLFNVPVIAYSGELDKQKDAADYMAEMFQKEGRELTHLIGPGTEHKYHLETKRELLARLNKILADSQAQLSETAPQSHLQTRTLRYSAGNWLCAFGLEEHWQESRLDGRFRDGHYDITTKNVTRLQVIVSAATKPATFTIDGQTLKEQPLPVDIPIAHFERRDGRWFLTNAFVGRQRERYGLCKWPKLQGPIDDAFMDRFLVVLPSGQAAHPRVQQWLDFELAHLRERWGSLFRGEPLVKKDTEVTVEDMQNHNLICFGDAQSNKLIRQALPNLPITWTKDKLELGGQSYNSSTHVPLMIFPNPLLTSKEYSRYIVLNSGPTFREAHDRTNSLQNPKLPDWAIIDITTPPDGEKPGKVVAADFFDEQWQVKKK